MAVHEPKFGSNQNLKKKKNVWNEFQLMVDYSDK